MPWVHWYPIGGSITGEERKPIFSFWEDKETPNKNCGQRYIIESVFPRQKSKKNAKFDPSSYSRKTLDR